MFPSRLVTLRLIRSTTCASVKCIQPHRRYGEAVNERVQTTKEPVDQRKPTSFMSGLLKNFVSARNSQLDSLGHVLYEEIADNMKYIAIVERYKLPDTFYTWFTITELHIWMLAARLMAEGDEGKTLRNRIIEAMWGDVRMKTSKLENVSNVDVRGQLNILQEQFQAAIIGYDEGLMSEDDRVLAGAVWRRIFQMNCDDLAHVEDFVRFIRRQMKELDELTIDDLLTNPKILWLTSDILSDKRK